MTSPKLIALERSQMCPNLPKAMFAPSFLLKSTISLIGCPIAGLYTLILSINISRLESLLFIGTAAIEPIIENLLTATSLKSGLISLFDGLPRVKSEPTLKTPNSTFNSLVSNPLLYFFHSFLFFIELTSNDSTDLIFCPKETNGIKNNNRITFFIIPNLSIQYTKLFSKLLDEGQVVLTL